MIIHIQGQLLSSLRLFEPPWTVARQAPLPMGFPRQEYQSGLPLLSPGDLPDPGIEPGSPALQAVSLPIEPRGKMKNLNNYQRKTVTHLLILKLLSLHKCAKSKNFKKIQRHCENIFTCSSANQSYMNTLAVAFKDHLFSLV